jgi:hypothetical protein
MPRTIFRATDRRRSSRLGAAAAPDVPEMDMLHDALECVQACERGVQKSAEAGSPHAIRAGSQPRAPAGPQHERFASCERRGVRGACTRRGHTFRGAGRAREAGGAPRLAEDVGLVSLGPARPAHPPLPLAPALRALAERLQRGPAAERGQASPRGAREPRARGKRATKGPGRSGRGLGRSTPPPRPATAPRSRPRHRSYSRRQSLISAQIRSAPHCGTNPK